MLALSSPSPLEQVRYVRSQAVLPVLIMIIDPMDKQTLQVKFLDEGADLVVMRPYSTRLLISQVQTLLGQTFNPPPLRLSAQVLI